MSHPISSFLTFDLVQGVKGMVASQAKAKLKNIATRSAGSESVSATEAGYYRKVFESFAVDSDGNISPLELMNRLHAAGLSPRDPRVRDSIDQLAPDGEGADRGLSFQRFVEACQSGGQLIARAVRGDLVIPDFPALTGDISEMYDQLRSNDTGSVADYIPQLGRVDPRRFGVALCTTDGQRFSLGDAQVSFCVQSVW
ncbi:glutaminase [Nocardia sp. NPDC052278]|uniref:glutaminase n=1 Tax=unclassified Nocardia TaxID=2637762 RepID=UPI0036C2F5DD